MADFLPVLSAADIEHAAQVRLDFTPKGPRS
jgi:hypothetical protein